MIDSANTSIPEEELVARARVGSLAAFEELANRHERRVYSLALRMLRHEQDAQDVTQQTFLEAIEHLGSFRGEASFSTWLLRIASHAALKVLRKRKGLETLPLDTTDDAAETADAIPRPHFIADWSQSPAALAERRETSRLIEESLVRLDEKHRIVFLLRDVEGLSVKETATALGISEANVKVRLLRARLLLRELLTAAFGDPATRIEPGQHRH